MREANRGSHRLLYNLNRITIALIALPLLDSAPASAQTSAVPTEPLARFVPIEAGFYVRFSDRQKWQQLFNGQGDGFSDAQTMLPVAQSTLMSHMGDGMMAIASYTWLDRRDLITIIKPQHPEAFGQALRMNPEAPTAQIGDTNVHQVGQRMWIAINRGVFILSELGLDSTMFHKSCQLLGSDRKIRSLIDDVRFCEQLSETPPSSSAALFIDEAWALRSSPRKNADQPPRPNWLPDLQVASARTSLADQRVTIHVKAKRRRHVGHSLAVSPSRLSLLPDSTAFAFSGSMHVGDAIGYAATQLPKALAIAGQISHGLAQAALDEELHLAGQHQFTVFGVPSDDHGVSIALIIHTPQAKRLAAAVARVAQLHAGLPSRSEAQLQAITASSYKGRTVYTVDLMWPARPKDPWAALKQVDPVICGTTGHFMLATDRLVLQRVLDAIDAEHRWQGLSSFPDGSYQVLAFVDPLAMASALGSLQHILSPQNTDLADSEWFQDLLEYFNDTPVQLGVRLAKDDPNEPGRVRVLSVLKGYPATDKLRPGDIVLGIDGQLLTLEGARDDLKRKLRAQQSGGRRTIRIERRGEIVDVVVWLPKPNDKSFYALLMDAGNMISHMRALGAFTTALYYKQVQSTSVDELRSVIELNIRDTSAP